MRAVAVNPQAHWRARLNLEFRSLGERTVLVGRRHSGPLRVQKPFYPEAEVCHVYVLHPPGGVVGGDELHTEVLVGSGAALLTTPAATKVYRSARHHSVIEQRLQVRAGGSLEWLPQGTLLFGGSRLRQRSVIELSSEAGFCAWEINALGRPHSGDHYATGECEQAVDIRIDGTPVLIERQTWRARDAVMSAPWGLQGKTAIGSMYAYPADADTLARAREVIATISAAAVVDAAVVDAAVIDAAATLVDGVLVVRALADDAVGLQQLMAAVWSSVRPLVIGRPACPPRIWAT